VSQPPPHFPFPHDPQGAGSWPAGPQGTAPLLAAAPPQKPFLKRPWVWGVAAALVVGIGIGNASAGSDEVVPSEAAATSTSSSTAASSTPAPPPSVVPPAAVAPTPSPTVPPPAPSTPPPPAPTTPPPPVVDFAMPGLVGLDLQTAQNTVQTFGVFLSRSHDLLGSRNQVLDSNWVVCTQNIPPGQRVTGDAEGLIDLGVVKREESCP
jgi:hypothetical protein